MTGARLRDIRHLRGVTQARMAELLGCHERTIRRNESRERVSAWLQARPRWWLRVERFARGAARGAAERREKQQRLRWAA